jgi:hypothetical protein
MAKKFIDVAINDDKSAYELGDGTALSLTGQVRVVYNDALNSATLYSLLTRIRDRILEGSAPDAD